MLSRDQQLAAEHAQHMEIMGVELVANDNPSVSAIIPITVPHEAYNLRRQGVRRVIDAIDLCMN